MDDAALLRYSRHILLNDIGVEAQQRFERARVLIVGLGGLGSSAAIFLAASGIGTLELADGDAVELSNLQRQIIHSQSSIGRSKVHSAQERIAQINSLVRVELHPEHADATWLAQAAARADCVLDCTDRFATRQLINAACLAAKTPLVSGAALGFDAQLVSFDFRQSQSPCYACLFPAETAPEEQQCATFGVFAPLVGMVGAMQAAQALKLIGGFGLAAPGELTMIDAREMRFTRLRHARQDSCQVCG